VSLSQFLSQSVRQTGLPSIALGTFGAYGRQSEESGEEGTPVELFLAGVAENADKLAVLSDSFGSLTDSSAAPDQIQR
jgi:hypothetical protein